MYTWRTDENGVVHVSDDGGPEFVPNLTEKAAARCEHGIARFGLLFRIKGEKFSVPWEWLVAMGFQESGFDPNAVSGFHDGGVGLFQITHPSLKAGHSDEQLKDPELNTEIAARHIAGIISLFGGQLRNDFPRVSAAFNAGSPRPDHTNKWNLHCTPGHIDSEVAALNYTMLRAVPKQILPETIPFFTNLDLLPDLGQPSRSDG